MAMPLVPFHMMIPAETAHDLSLALLTTMADLCHVQAMNKVDDTLPGGHQWAGALRLQK